MKAYRVKDLIVFAGRGTEAKVLAAPEIQPMEAWQQDVAAWVSLRAERAPEWDAKVDETATEPYIHS